MNPKTPIKEEMREQIKYLASGAVDTVEVETTHRGKKLSYDIEAIATALSAGKKFVLPSSVERVNTIYDIMKTLKAKDKKFNRVSYGAVKGTVQKHIVKSKNNKEYSYTTAQYFLFLES